ncbi:MAG: tRNA (adenosine(37)-N6)-threonylcarbamoyltransferase complex dimerization subunit type 1 TsaB [Janthinobacterium lividum]
MRVLVLNGASGATGASFGLLTRADDVTMLMSEGLAAGQGGAERLPLLLADRLAETGWAARTLGLIAVVVGPGSFTGLRASLALAHGLALGSGASVIGVTVGEALGPALHDLARSLDIPAIWCVSQARRDRVFIERPVGAGWQAEAAMLDRLPATKSPVLLGGDAAHPVADRLRELGVAAHHTGLSAPSAVAIAEAALARRAGMLPPLDSQPLYVDPPEAKLPQVRPSPAPG